MEQLSFLESMLRKDGLSPELLDELSYQSQLGINLNKDLRCFDREKLFEELKAVSSWYDSSEILQNIPADYRVKSWQSVRQKFWKCYPNTQCRKACDDLLGFRCLCQDYEEVFLLSALDNFRVVDMSRGKSHDDGYRGVHVYYQKSAVHYPIEIQYNTYYDRQLNNWLYRYTYKKNLSDTVGRSLRLSYEDGDILTDTDFEKELDDVLSGR